MGDAEVLNVVGTGRRVIVTQQELDCAGRGAKTAVERDECALRASGQLGCQWIRAVAHERHLAVRHGNELVDGRRGRRGRARDHLPVPLPKPPAAQRQCAAPPACHIIVVVLVAIGILVDGIRAGTVHRHLGIGRRLRVAPPVLAVGGRGESAVAAHAGREGLDGARDAILAHVVVGCAVAGVAVDTIRGATVAIAVAIPIAVSVAAVQRAAVLQGG